jgi:hypothetical protein
MGAKGAVFQPEDIELMKAILDEAIAALPMSQQTSSMKAELASNILSMASQGDRDPIRLREAALQFATNRSRYPSHDISVYRQAV